MQMFELREQDVVAGRLLDHLVKLVVGASPPDCLVAAAAASLARLDRSGQAFAELFLRFVQPVELVVADPCCGELGRKRLELRTHFVCLADLARRQSPDERAAMRLELDEPARLELPQRLADRCPADAELGGERALPEARAGGNVPVQHPPLEVGGELVDERPTLGGLRHGFDRTRGCIHLTSKWIHI
jgi:hypothetical protein